MNLKSAEKMLILIALSGICRYCQSCEKVRFPGLFFFMLPELPLRNASGVIPCLLFAFLYVVVILWFILWLVNKTHRNFNTGWIAGVVVAMLIFICGIWAAEIDFNKEKKALVTLRKILYCTVR